MTLPPLHSLDDPPPINWRMVAWLSPVVLAAVGVVALLSAGLPWRPGYAVQLSGNGLARTWAEKDYIGDRPYDYLVRCQDPWGCRLRASRLCSEGYLVVTEVG